MLSALCAVVILSGEGSFKSWGLETLKEIRKSFLLPKHGLYAESIDNGKASGPSYCWSAGVTLSALNSAAKADPAWKKDLREYVDATRLYWDETGPVAGFNDAPGLKQANRYYDDNEWMVLALVDASEILGDPKILARAEETLKFVLSGEDEKLGGGIYWYEPKKQSKNTCSNGPGAAACLAVYQKTGKAEYLQKARELYDWTKKNLQDPSDGLFWDNINLTGHVEKTKWSYNTALMIRSAAVLGKIIGEKQYSEDAERMAEASERRWIDPATGAIKDGGRFAHLLLDSWNYVPTHERQEKARVALRWLHENGRTPQGWYGGRFDRAADPKKAKFELIDQASVARAYLEAR